MKIRFLLLAVMASSIYASGAQAVELYPGYFGLSVGQATVDGFCSGGRWPLL